MAPVGAIHSRPGGRGLYHDENDDTHTHNHALDDEFALANMVDIEEKSGSNGASLARAGNVGGSGDGNTGINDASADITALQKMVSAMSGSLLTSLLGKSSASLSFNFSSPCPDS